MDDLERFDKIYSENILLLCKKLNSIPSYLSLSHISLIFECLDEDYSDFNKGEWLWEEDGIIYTLSFLIDDEFIYFGHKFFILFGVTLKPL